MLHLLQLLKTLNKEGRDEFCHIFQDFKQDIEDCGDQGHEVEAFKDRLSQHFGMIIDSDWQNEKITEAILDGVKFKRAVDTANVMF